MVSSDRGLLHMWICSTSAWRGVAFLTVQSSFKELRDVPEFPTMARKIYVGDGQGAAYLYCMDSQAIQPSFERFVMICT